MLETIRNIICDYVDIDPSEITEDSVLRTDLGMNSLDCVSLIQDLEQKYNLTIPSKDLNAFRTIGDIITYLEQNPLN